MKRALFFDFDSTVVTKESLDETIALALEGHPERERVLAEIEEITNLGMEGKLAFTQSVSRRLATLMLTKSHFQETGEMLTHHITPGMSALSAWSAANGIPFYIVSGGFRESVFPVAQILNVPNNRILTNTALFDMNGALIGPDTSNPLWTDTGKTAAILDQKSKDALAYVVLIGDGANDLAAYDAGAVDAFIGFGGNVTREHVKMNAPYFVVSGETLLPLLKKILG